VDNFGQNLWIGADRLLDRLAATPPHRAARRGAAAAAPNIYPQPCIQKKFLK
jgi:hypothetical protein